MNRKFYIKTFALLLLLTFFAASHQKNYNHTVLRIIDGDTIVVFPNSERIRYIGIDTSEMPDEYYAKEATEINRIPVYVRKVRLEYDF